MKITHFVERNKFKLMWIALALVFALWMAWEQAQGSPLQFVAALCVALVMLPAAMTDWR